MPNTTNFNWSTPADTDLVKNGASAIRTLGSAIDTSFVDFKGGTTGQVLKKTSNTDLDVEWGTASSGLTLINTTSFSAVASQAVTPVFSATYENYRVLIRITAQQTTNGDHYLRMRSGATDDTGGNYFSGGYLTRFNAGTIGAFNQNAGTFYRLGDGITTATGIYYVLDILSPFLAQKTGISLKGASEDATYSYAVAKDGIHNLTTSYDGYNIITSAGTFSGKVSTYGYNF